MGKSYLLFLDLVVKVFRYFVANDKFFVERCRVFVVIHSFNCYWGIFWEEEIIEVFFILKE